MYRAVGKSERSRTRARVSKIIDNNVWMCFIAVFRSFPDDRRHDFIRRLHGIQTLRIISKVFYRTRKVVFDRFYGKTGRRRLKTLVPLRI